MKSASLIDGDEAERRNCQPCQSCGDCREEVTASHPLGRVAGCPPPPGGKESLPSEKRGYVLILAAKRRELPTFLLWHFDTAGRGS